MPSTAIKADVEITPCPVNEGGAGRNELATLAKGCNAWTVFFDLVVVRQKNLLSTRKLKRGYKTQYKPCCGAQERGVTVFFTDRLVRIVVCVK